MSSEQSSEESPDDLVLSAGDLDMSTQVLPEKLYSMSTPEVTRYMERYVTAKCDARESDLLNEYRKDREERDKLEVEFSRAGSATGRAVRNHITLQTILRSRGASTKTAQLATQTQTRSVLSRLVRERDDLEARLNDCKGRLLTYQQKARSLGSILVEEKVSQYHDFMYMYTYVLCACETDGLRFMSASTDIFSVEDPPSKDGEMFQPLIHAWVDGKRWTIQDDLKELFGSWSCLS